MGGKEERKEGRKAGREEWGREGIFRDAQCLALVCGNGFDDVIMGGDGFCGVRRLLMS